VVKKFDDVHNRLDTISTLDRRTQQAKQYRAVHVMHTDAW